MPDFLRSFHEAVHAERAKLSARLRGAHAAEEDALARFVRREHWHPLPAEARAAVAGPAAAVDGSLRQMGLADGSTLFVVQALALGGDGLELPSVAVEVLPSDTPRATASRFGDLLQQSLELTLALDAARRLPRGGTLFLDGALYGRLPQLYPLPLGEGLAELEALPERIITTYATLLAEARQRELALLAVSKTSREATHGRLWLRAAGRETPIPEGLSDGALVHRYTELAPGLSTPVVLGSWSFTGGSQALLERDEVAGSPAIVSFFVRLAPFDDALRVDVPASLCGDETRLAEIDGGLLDGGPAALAPAVGRLRADHGGAEVYNALLYSVDRAVRLRRDTVAEVYLPLLEELLGTELRLDRSERRFV